MRYLKSRGTAWSTAGIMFIATTILALQLNQTVLVKNKLEEENEELDNNIQDVEEEKDELSEEVVELQEVVDEKEQVIKEKESSIKKVKQEIKKKEEIVEEKNREIKKLKQSQTQVKNTVAKNSISANNSSNNKNSSTAKSSGGNGKVYNNIEATFYSAFCDTGCTGVTATGIDVSSSIYHKGLRVIAVDPNVIKLGTRVRVTGGGQDFEAIAADTGGDIKGSRIDILVGSTEEAYRLGRKQVKVEILD